MNSYIYPPIIELSKLKKPRKYRNQPTFVDSMRFDSKKEASRYKELKLLEKSGYITNLECQPKFEFMINGEPLRYVHSNRKITYKADFRYKEKGATVVEDVKSKITQDQPVYKIKKALMRALNDIEILET